MSARKFSRLSCLSREPSSFQILVLCERSFLCIHIHTYIHTRDYAESPFDPEGRVTSYALYKVEREGVQLRSGISSKNRDFQALLRLKQPDANFALMKWLTTSNKSDIKPTWRNLLLVLRLLSLDELAEPIEAHLGWTCMKQLPKGNSSRAQNPQSKLKVSCNKTFILQVTLSQS